MQNAKQTRLEIESLLQRGAWQEAHVLLGRLWRAEAGTATAGFVISCYEQLRGHMPLTGCRVNFLRSMTIEPLVPLLRAAAFVSGIEVTVQVAPFNAYAQQIIEPNSPLYSFDPDIVVLAVQTRDILPDIWDGYADLSPMEIRAALTRVQEDLALWIRTFRERSAAALIVHTFEKPIPSTGILDAQHNDGQLAAIEGSNAELRRSCGELRGVYVLDYDELVARHGRDRWHDEAKWLSARMPFASESTIALTSEWLKFIHALTGTGCKVVAVDLDNTLWGGILGEDGPSGIALGTEYPGAFYRSFQRVLLDLHRRGVLIAVCSKNDHDEAVTALQSHPGMLLRPEHFAAFRINWKDKPSNLREIAEELNIGTDAIAFVDDSPVEREHVRREIPEVKVVDLPDRPEGFAAVLRDCPFFQRLSLSAEDRGRTDLYRVQQQRASVARNAVSIEDFYRSLGQEVTIAPVTAMTMSRVAQLTQKTNQFNVTTRRYSEQEIAALAASPDWDVYSVGVRDRFGDNGIVGVLIAHTSGGVREIDTFVLSCRVIGRTVETAMLGYLTEISRAEGIEFLRGWYLPTKKNAPAQSLYSSHQFEQFASQGDATLWSLDLMKAHVVCPSWIRLDTTSTERRGESVGA